MTHNEAYQLRVQCCVEQPMDLCSEASL